MAKEKVSSDFAKFYGKNATAIEDAKKAENSLGGTPVPIGWSGQCILVDCMAAKGKDKKNSDGTMRPGNPYVNLKFQVVGDEQYQGKTFTINFTFNDTANATAADRFGWFLNAIENMGVPREVRENHESMQELFDCLEGLDTAFEARCVEDSYRDDGKKMLVSGSAEPLSDGTSIKPPTSSAKVEVGSTVTFLGNEWNVIEVLDDAYMIEKEGSPVRKVAKDVVA